MPSSKIAMCRKPQQLFWGMVALSITLHGVVSVVPWPQASVTDTGQRNLQFSEDDTAIATETSAIAIAQLPTAQLPTAQLPTAQLPTAQLPIKSAPIPEGPAALTPAPTVQSRPQPPTPQEPISAYTYREPAPSPPQDLPSQTAEGIEPFENSQAQTALDPEAIDSAAIDPEENPIADPEEELASTESGQDSQPEQGVLLQLTDDFPHLSGASSGCFRLSNCHRASGNYRDVVQQLTEQMQANGYQLTENDTIDGTGHRVFEVVMPNEPGSLYYLNVFSDGLESAVYAITVNILSLDELKSLQA